MITDSYNCFYLLAEKETKGKSLRKGGRKSKSSKPYKPPAKKQKTSHDVTGGCKSGQGRSAVTDGSAMSKVSVLRYAIGHMHTELSTHLVK